MSYQEEHGGHAISRLAPVRRRSPWRVQSSLPAPLTSFVGREQEIAALTAHLAETRLLTLTGIGGIGKSRLALEVARLTEGEDTGQIVLVELAVIAEPIGVVAAIASRLGVQERGDRPLLDGVVTSLADRDVLLMLDNCEHLVEAVASVALELLQRCPDVRVLATSRIPLELDGEATWRVEPLAAPDPERPPVRSTVARYPAVQLFVDRARAARSEFHLTAENIQDVARICARLDGIPLAIELAAARVNVLNPGEIVRRLDDRFRLLTSENRSTLPRHRTLRALIDWSCDLLDARERILFRRLAVFAGGWTLAAAEAVCSGRCEPPDPGAPSPQRRAAESDSSLPTADGLLPADVLDVLSRLVSKSLIQTDHSRGETRFGLLETIREYALDLLRDAGEEPQLRQRHLDWVVTMAEQADAGLWTSEQAAWLARLDAELENVRAALTWSTGPGDAESGLRIAGGLWRFWEQRGHAGEALRWLSTLLGRPATGPTPARAMALEVSAYLTHLTGDLAASQAFAEASFAMAREVNDVRSAICALLSRGIVLGTSGEISASQATFAEALTMARSAGWEPGVRMALLDLGVLARMTGDVELAITHFEAGRALTEAAGDSYALGFYLINLAHLALQQGDSAAAITRYRQALLIWRDLQDTHNLAMALEGLAWAVGAQRHAQQAANLLGAAEALRELVGTILLPHWQADHDQARAAAQAALGEQAFATAWAEGRMMTVQQAIACGLATPDGRSVAGQTRRGRSSGPRRDAVRPTLSSREAQVARLVARGLTNRQIAEALTLQESTVGNHLQRIYARLELTGRAQLVAWLAEHNQDNAADRTASVSESDR